MNKKKFMVVANGQIITESRFFYPAFDLSLFLSQELLLWHCIVFRLDLLKIKTKWWLASMLCNNNSASFRLFMTSREMINTLVIYSKSFSVGICFI